MLHFKCIVNSYNWPILFEKKLKLPNQNNDSAFTGGLQSHKSVSLKIKQIFVIYTYDDVQWGDGQGL